MIGAYRVNNTRVEAVQYTGDNFEECRDFVGAALLTQNRKEEYRGPDGKPAAQWVLKFDHPLTTQFIYPGYWLIRIAGKHLQLAQRDEYFRVNYTSEG